MKKFYLFVFSVSVFLIQAQQVSIMQPAIKNSNLKLDSIYIQTDFAIRANIDNLSEKWIAKTYDTDKNPTEFMVYNYLFSQNPVDSTKVILEHYPHNNYNSDYRKQLLHDETDDSSNYFKSINKIYKLFNIKSVIEKKYNPQTDQWIVKSYNYFLNDNRLNTNEKGVSYLYNFFDSNFNVTSTIRKDAIIEQNGLGYISEEVFYATNSSTPYLKYVYLNTYNGNNQLTESIKSSVDLVTNIETLIDKKVLTYTSNLFEYTTQLWDEVSNSWGNPQFKKSIFYDVNGSPISIINYNNVNGNWIEENNDTQNYFFNNGYFMDFIENLPPDVGGGLSLLYIYDSTTDLISNESFSDTYGAEGHGSYEEKEFYYSSDSDLVSVNDYNLNKLKVYPNPAKNTITINSETELSYSVYSIQGKKLLDGITSSSIDISKLQTGIYFIKFKTKNGFINKQFIIK